MKKTVYFACLLSLLCGRAFAQPQTQSLAERNAIASLNGPVIVFVNHDSLYDYGGIPLGESIPYQVEIVNGGNVPLIIAGMKCESANVKCKWPNKPLKPGKKAYITVTYTAKGDIGSFDHPIFVTSNATPGPVPYLRIKGAITPAGSSYSPTKKEPKNGVSVMVHTGEEGK